MCVVIANQLLTRHLPLAPLGQVNEWTAKSSRFSIQVVCRRFLELWRLKHWKIRIADSEVQTFFEGEENQCTKRKPKITYSLALVLAFLSAESENRQLEDLSLADFGLVSERLLLS